MTRHLYSECSIIQGLTLMVREQWSPKERDLGKENGRGRSDGVGRRERKRGEKEREREKEEER